jgi:hypothetical protein
MLGLGGREIAPTPEVANKAAPIGPASQRIAKLADDFRRGQLALGKKCTPEMAFTEIFTSPAHIELREQAKAEEAARRGM